MEALERAIAIAGSQAALAAAIETPEQPVTQQRVWNWLNRDKKVPADMAPAIERFTRSMGKPVLCEDLCPDVDWAVVRQHPDKRHPAKAV